MLDLHRNLFKGIEQKTAKIFAVLPFTPNQYTSFSLICGLSCAYFLIKGGYVAALMFFIVAAFLDFIDGAVARYKNLSTKKGAYWDTVADRYVEAIFLFGLLFVPMPDLYLPSYAWIFLVFLGSLMTTYAKAAAKEKELSQSELKGGLMSRAERFMAYSIVLFALETKFYTIIPYILAIVALLVNITAVQRIGKAFEIK